jgi:hypothetical protein
MTNHDPRKYSKVSLQAISRAARYSSAMRAKDYDGAAAAVHEAKVDGRLMEFGCAAGMLLANLADEHHGPERGQLYLDGLALDAGWFRDRELELLAQKDSDDDPE